MRRFSLFLTIPILSMVFLLPRCGSNPARAADVKALQEMKARAKQIQVKANQLELDSRAMAEATKKVPVVRPDEYHGLVSLADTMKLIDETITRDQSRFQYQDSQSDKDLQNQRKSAEKTFEYLRTLVPFAQKHLKEAGTLKQDSFDKDIQEIASLIQ